MHPLRMEYIKQIKSKYGICLWGDTKPERTEAFAQKIHSLGIDYETYIRLAIDVWSGWSEQSGHKYPYWNVVTSTKTLDRISELIKLASASDADANGIVCSSEFYLELRYALDLVDWYCNGGKKPTRIIPTKPHAKLRIAVAEYLCTLKRIPCHSSDYITIARQVKKSWN